MGSFNNSVYSDLTRASSQDVRAAFRRGDYSGHTSGIGLGRLQANVVILPAREAADFERFCRLNTKPCPLVAMSEPGDPFLPTLGQDIDIRHDLASYNIYRDGVFDCSVSDVGSLWKEDSVTFAIGCSYTFERALVDAGIPLRHIENNRAVSMYHTSLPLQSAGPFSGTTVVSMRHIRRDQVDKAIDVSSAYPQAHGAPVHVGDPATIGIQDLSKPDWGDVDTPEEDEVPVFWACGVTPQVTVRSANLPLVITHTPGSMLITDLDEMAEVPFFTNHNNV